MHGSGGSTFPVVALWLEWLPRCTRLADGLRAQAAAAKPAPKGQVPLPRRLHA